MASEAVASAHEADNTALPDLAQPAAAQTYLRPSAGGLEVDSNDAVSRFTGLTETSQRTGVSVGMRGALVISNAAVLGAGMQLGGNSSELFVNLGLNLGDAQRLMFTGGQLRQKLDFAFPSGTTRADMTQNSVGASWRLDLGSGLLEYAEANAYAARTASRDLNDITYAVDTATLYELWNDPRRVAGGGVGGMQGKVGIKPWEGGRVSLGLGHESLRYDLLAGTEIHQRATASLGAEHTINRQTRIKFGIDATAAQNRYIVGLDHHFGELGTLGTLGINLLKLHGRDGAPGDTRVQLSWTIPLGERSGATGANMNAAHSPATPQAVQWDDNLLDQVAARPAWMPSQVIARRDTSAGPTRLIAVAKAALPAGSTVDTATGAITGPLGAVVTGIAGITKNGGAFVNTGQFALSGNSLVINPNLITQPAVGVVDVYVVTVNNFGGGTTLVTVNVSRGSVKIDSIVVASGASASAAPTASAVSISGTTEVGQTLTSSYTYADANGDAQGTSTFRWLRNGVAIAGATASTYRLVNADGGAAISVEVTPVATVAPTTGTAVASAATAAITPLPAGYVSQGGLIWTPNNTGRTWTNANTYCTTTTILGQTGWRLPTTTELLSLYNSEAINGQGWALDFTWSSQVFPGSSHRVRSMNTGAASTASDSSTIKTTCVR